MRRTKIVCTLGPASSDPKIMDALLKAGMDVARINMSHGTHAGHAKVIRDLRAACKRAGRQVAILLDLQGPKIRVGKMHDGAVELKNGAALVLQATACLGTAARVSTSYRNLPRDCQAGDPILLDDGKLRLRVVAVKGTDVHTRVEVGGWLLQPSVPSFNPPLRPNPPASSDSTGKAEQSQASSLEWTTVLFLGRNFNKF